MGVSLNRSGARGLLRAVGHVVFPPLCHVCDGSIERHDEQLCLDCWNQLVATVGEERCRKCGDGRGPHVLIDGCCGACRTNRPGHVSFDGFVCVGRYAGPLRSLILDFKQHFVLDGVLGRLLGSRIAAADFGTVVDHWIPVPSHWLRRIRRGYEPTTLLARSTLKAIGKAPDRWLRMRRFVPEFHRYGLSASARSEAISGAIAIRRGVDVSGRSICLIDDVMTTGVTMAEAARVLRGNGARAVYAAVVARTQTDLSDGESGPESWRGASDSAGELDS